MDVSFTERGLLGLLSSNHFFPSNYEPRVIEDKGSIKVSLGTEIDIFERKKINHSRVQKFVRATERLIAGVAIGVIFGSCGFVWHGTFTVIHTFQWLRGGEHTNHHWQKVKNHAGSMFVDFGAALFTAFGFGSLGWVVAFAPDYVPSCLASNKRIVSMIKSIILKNQFGIMGKDGKLLKGNPEVDDETLALNNSHFSDLYRKIGFDILFSINDLQKKLPKNCQLPTMYPPTDVLRISTFLNRNREDFPDLDIDSWIKKFVTLKSNFDEITKILKNCLEQKENFILDERKKIVRMPPFPWKQEFCDLFFKADFIQSTSWEKKLDETIPWLTTRSGEGVSEEFIEYRARVRAKKKPYEILGLESEDESEEAIRKAYRRAALALHPDKVPQSMIQEGQALFDCIKCAYTCLISSKVKEEAPPEEEKKVMLLEA